MWGDRGCEHTQGGHVPASEPPQGRSSSFSLCPGSHTPLALPARHTPGEPASGLCVAHRLRTKPLLQLLIQWRQLHRHNLNGDDCDSVCVCRVAASSWAESRAPMNLHTHEGSQHSSAPQRCACTWGDTPHTCQTCAGIHPGTAGRELTHCTVLLMDTSAVSVGHLHIVKSRHSVDNHRPRSEQLRQPKDVLSHECK